MQGEVQHNTKHDINTSSLHIHNSCNHFKSSAGDGRGVKIVAEMLGHSQVSLCLDTYSRMLPSIQEEAINKLNTLLFKKG